MAGESFVDVRYRGLELGRRLKMHEFGPQTAYLEHAAPMPVGAPLDIEADDGVRLAATVIRVHEQVAGAERAPGMRVRCAELDEAAQSWWQELVTVADPVAAEIPDEEVAAVATGLGGAAEAEGAGDDAAEAAGDGAAEAEAGAAAAEDADAAEAPHKGDAGDIVDDGKKTEIMSAVVPEAAEVPDEASAEGEARAAKSDEAAEGSSDDAGKKKRGRRGRRKKR